MGLQPWYAPDAPSLTQWHGLVTVIISFYSSVDTILCSDDDDGIEHTIDGGELIALHDHQDYSEHKLPVSRP